MRLSTLLGQALDQDAEFNGLSLDSRFIHPGEVFVALSGNASKGQDFIPMALERGAVAILTDAPVAGAFSVPVVQIESLRYRVSELAARFYADPSQDLVVVGVTGTNGKSSVCDLLQQAWRQLGLPAAAIGTLGVYGETQWRRPGMTTADPIQVQAELAMLRDAGVSHVAMEVSSHGLDQGRVEAVQFAVGVFTNLTRDHLDYHGSLEAYAQAKQRLFTALSTHSRVLHAGTPQAMEMLDSDSLSYGPEGQVRIQDAQPGSNGWQFNLVYQDQSVPSHCKLLGDFNLDNLAAVVAVLMRQGFELPAIAQVLPALAPVPGRMEWVSTEPAVLVDYAHTPDGLAAALQAARAHCAGSLWVVFGAGGDRDAGKRPEMGAVASQYADHLIITSDNPRSEAPADIIADIAAGVTASSHQILDRIEAIEYGLAQMSAHDVLVIAGKGHETDQILASGAVHHDDREVARAWLEAAC